MEVLLPAPFGPRNPKIEPRGTVSESCFTATFAPYSLRRLRVSIADEAVLPRDLSPYDRKKIIAITGQIRPATARRLNFRIR